MQIGTRPPPAASIEGDDLAVTFYSHGCFGIPNGFSTIRIPIADIRRLLAELDKENE